MTGNVFLDLAISLAGVAVLVAVSYLLGGWRSAPVDEASARERLSFDEPDFTPGDWLFGRDGKGAAAISEDGREAAFVFAVGDGLSTRRVACGRVTAEADGETLLARLRDPSKWTLKLAAGSADEAARWASRLSAEGYSQGHGHDVP